MSATVFWAEEKCEECGKTVMLNVKPGYWKAVADGFPPDGVTVLCKGRSYDSDHQGGKFLASYYSYWEPPKWVIGKQQEEPEEVTHWAPVPA